MWASWCGCPATPTFQCRKLQGTSTCPTTKSTYHTPGALYGAGDSHPALQQHEAGGRQQLFTYKAFHHANRPTVPVPTLFSKPATCLLKVRIPSSEESQWTSHQAAHHPFGNTEPLSPAHNKWARLSVLSCRLEVTPAKLCSAGPSSAAPTCKGTTAARSGTATDN
jgi:hypothetical protein